VVPIFFSLIILLNAISIPDPLLPLPTLLSLLFFCPLELYNVLSVVLCLLGSVVAWSRVG
jgi:hypothetical protein